MSKINNALTDKAEDLDVVMPMYNLIKCSKSYSKTSGSLWNYYRGGFSDDTSHNYGLNKNVTESKSFKYKKNITGSTIDYDVSQTITNAEGDDIPNLDYDANKIGTKEVEIVLPLKYLINFWRELNMDLINCEVNQILTWSANCVITSMEKQEVTAAQGDNLAVFDNNLTGTTFKTIDAKLYLPVVTLSAQDNKISLQQLKKNLNDLLIE